MFCASCGSENPSVARFCQACGATLQAAGVAPRAVRASRGVLRPVLLALCAVAAVVVGVAGYGEYAQRQREAAYARALVALEDRNLEDAVYELRRADDHLDAPSRLKDAEAALARVASLYAEAQEHARIGQWGDTADALRQALELHSKYRDAENRLAEARAGQEAAYVRAQEARGQRRLEDALRELRVAGGHKDAAVQWSEVERQLARVTALYAAAEEHARKVEWWEATVALRQVAVFYPTYRDAESRLAEARAKNGLIAFTSNRDGNREIYVMPADGDRWVEDNPDLTFEDYMRLLPEVKRLTNHHAGDIQPAWSPDGTRIAFASARNANWEIYLMGADGSDPIRLTAQPAQDEFPAWSPDGTRIAFTSDSERSTDIHVMDSDGSNLTRLTNHGTSLVTRPAWSPDGKHIAFDSDRGGTSAIYVMDADGSNQRLVDPVFGRNVNSGPAWSPDGTRIAFFSRSGPAREIYAMDADGRKPVRLTNNPADDVLPVWSPDGRHIAFVSDREGQWHIYVMAANGSNPTRVTAGPVTENRLAWGRGTSN